MKILTHRSLWLALLLSCPLFAAAHGYGYYTPPAYGYYTPPAYGYGYYAPPSYGYARPPAAYVQRPFFVKPYPYGSDRRYGGYYAPRADYGRGYGGWRNGPYGGAYGGRGGGYPRSGFSFSFSN